MRPNNAVKVPTLQPELLEFSPLHFLQFQLALSSFFVQFDSFFEVFLSFADPFALFLANLRSHVLGKFRLFLFRFRIFDLLPLNQLLLSPANRRKTHSINGGDVKNVLKNSCHPCCDYKTLVQMLFKIDFSRCVQLQLPTSLEMQRPVIIL